MDNPSKPRFVPPPGAIDAHCPCLRAEAQFPFSAKAKYHPEDAGPEMLFAIARPSRLFARTSSSRRAATAPTTRRRSTPSPSPRARRAASRWSIRPFPTWSCCASHAGGIRGVRFNFLKRLVDDAPKDRFLEVARRIEPLGWHVVVYFEAELLDELRPFLEAIPTIIVVDHLGRPDVAQGPDGADMHAFSACSTSIPTSGPR